MIIEKKIALILNIGGIAMAALLGLAAVFDLGGFRISSTLALIGIMVAVATPVAGIITAMIVLFRSGETKYAAYATILLMMIIIAGVWRLLI